MSALSAVAAANSAGQPATAASTRAAATSAPSGIRVWVITMGRGSLVYEQFGHNAIWVHDARTGLSRVYNYGIFDFNQKNFILRFIQGRMLYRMEAANPEAELAYYAASNRSVWLQELNLQPQQADQLLEFLEWNRQPESREYRYNYYTDNCSTRVRDALDRVLNGQLQRQLKDQATGTTYRWHTRQIMCSDIPLYTALYFVLGPFVDQPISGWEESFLPLRLQARLRQVQVRDGNGELVPLVKREVQWFQSSRDDGPAGPPAWVGRYLSAGVLLGVVFAVLGWLGRRARWARVIFVVLGAAWALLMGCAGGFLAGAWMFTSHVSVYGNENLLHCSPLALPLAILLLARFKRWAARPVLWLAGAVLASSLLGLLLKLLPTFGQVNGELIAWVLPTHAGLLAGLWFLAPARRLAAAAPAKLPAPDASA